MSRPKTDGKPVWDVIIGLHTYPTVLAAHELKLFSLLAGKELTLENICESLNLTNRSASAVLSICTSLGLIEFKNNYYSLTTVAREYLLETSPTSFCGYFDLMIANAASFSYEGIKKAILSDKTQVYNGEDIFEVHEQKDEIARSFTRAMHSASISAALAWPETINLSGYRQMLDIAGGSGAHSIGATSKYPDLKATVLDLAPICEVAQEFVMQQGLQSRIGTQVGNMWKDSFPEADLHFYSLIYHDWTPDQCRFLTKKSFDSLKPGGRLIIHEWLFNDERTQPLSTAAYNLIMLLWCAGGQQYSGLELSTMLAEAGFVDIQVLPTFGYWSIVTGQKPK
ncbi:acetylserotonin O-methyltransferase [Nostoc sp. T09]|uniref:acetylserotonin O-methyltransferase n=1 Tax=Nostoc sp. T09 TaxID=1932621 RepID=UPI00211ABDC4|nr:acetylserotonin O-methyltransferase [Nostoc sp. T09]